MVRGVTNKYLLLGYQKLCLCLRGKAGDVQLGCRNRSGFDYILKTGDKVVTALAGEGRYYLNLLRNRV